MDGPATKRLMTAIGQWIKELDSYPGWREWNRRKFGKILDYDDPWPSREGEPPLGDFQFDPEVEGQHATAMGFIRLHATAMSLADVEYYFRRYPFQDLPVSHYDHLNNICEMYFGRFYEFKSRLKNYLNFLKQSAQPNLPVGAFLKMYERIFDPELRARNAVDHRERFSDLSIDSVAIMSLVSIGNEAPSHLRLRMRAAYRKATGEWAERTRRRAKTLDQFVEAIAEIVLKQCAFLGERAPVDPPSSVADDAD